MQPTKSIAKEKLEASYDEALDAPRPLPMVRVERRGYVVDIGRQGPHCVFHFFPVEPGELFETRMESALLSAFKFEDRLQTSYEPEMRAWSVCALGAARNPHLNELATRAVEHLDAALEAAGYPDALPPMEHSPL